MRVGIVLVLIRDAGPAVRAEPGEMCVGAHVRAIEAADEFDALVVSAGAAVKVGESGRTTQSLRRGTVIQQEIDGHIHVRAGRGMPVPLAIRRQELVLRFVVHQRAEVLAVHGDPGIEPPLRAGGVAPLSHMVQDQVRAIPVRLVHGGQSLAGVCLVLLRGIPVRFDVEAVHIGDLVRGEPIGRGELEIAVLHGGDFTVLQVMHRQTGSGLVSRESDTARGPSFGGLDGVLLAVLTGGHAAGRVLRVLVVGETIGELEAQIVDHGILVDATVGEHGLAAGRDIRAGIHLPIVGMVPRGMVALGGVHRIGMRGDDRADRADPVTVFRAGAGHVHAAHLQRPQMVLVRSDEHLHAARVALGSTRMADAHGVRHTRLRVDGLADGTAAMHVRAHIAVLLPVKLERGGLMVAAGQLLPAERRLAQSGDLMSRPCGVDVVVVRPCFAFCGTHVHPVQSAVIELRIVRHVEARIHGQRLGRIDVRDGLHGSVGLGLGGLGGVLPATLVRRNLAGGIRSVLVVVQAVCLVEHDVVEHVAVVELLGVDALEREAGRGLPVGDQVGALVGLPLVGVVAVVAVRDLGGDGRGLLVEFVAVPVDAGAGHLDGLLVAGRADHDLHLVEVRAVEAGVLQPHLVQGAGHGPDVLVDGCAGLVGAELRVHVVGGGVVVLEFDRVGLLLDVASGLLRAGPAELGLVPPVDGGPLPAGAIGKAGGVQGLARVRVDAGPAAEAVLPLVVVVHAEVAVDQMVRQAGVGIRDGLDGSAGLGLSGLDGVLLATLVRRDGAGRVARVLIVCELVRLAETDVIQQIAVPRAVSLDATEGETRDGAGGDVRAGVRLPLARMRSLLELIAGGHLRVADLGADDRADLAELVSMPVRGGAGGFLRGLLARFADDDAHLVQVAGVETGVFEAPLVHDSRNGGDILVDGSAGLGGADLAVMVGSVGRIVDLHVVGAFEVRIVGIAGLRAVPGEFRLVEALGQLVSLSEHRPVCEV